MVLQPNRQLRSSYTPLVSMRVGLGATAAEPGGALVSPHSSPRQRGRVRWLVTRQFLSAIPIFQRAKDFFPTQLGVSNCRFRKRTTARSHLSTRASFLLISSFSKQTSFVLPISLFWGRGEGRHEEKILGGWGWGGGVCRILQLLFTSLSSTIKGREKLKKNKKIFKSQYYKVTFG